MHGAVEFCKDKETSSEELSYFRLGGDGVWEDGPEKGDCTACCHSCQFIGSKQVNGIVWLAVRGSDFKTKLSNLWKRLVNYCDVEVLLLKLTWSSYPIMTFKVTMAITDGPKNCGFLT